MAPILVCEKERSRPVPDLEGVCLPYQKAPWKFIYWRQSCTLYTHTKSVHGTLGPTYLAKRIFLGRSQLWTGLCSVSKSTLKIHILETIIYLVHTHKISPWYIRPNLFCERELFRPVPDLERVCLPYQKAHENSYTYTIIFYVVNRERSF